MLYIHLPGIIISRSQGITNTTNNDIGTCTSCSSDAKRNDYKTKLITDIEILSLLSLVDLVKTQKASRMILRCVLCQACSQ